MAPTDPKKQKNEGAPIEFDAIKAAEELAASLGLEGVGPSSGGAAYEVTLEEEIEELNGLIDARDARISELEAALVKAAAARDAANEEIGRASARIAKEEAKRNVERQKKLLLEFLEVVDDFDRALEAGEKSGHDTILDGVEIVRHSLVKKLADYGVTHYPSAGARFDPNLHDAISLVPVTETAKDGVVIAVVLEGYRFGDEILRPARVAVGKRG